MYNTVLVSLDGSRSAEAILPEVEKLERMKPGKVVLLRVGPTLDLERAEEERAQVLGQPQAIDEEEYILLHTATEMEIRRYLEAIGQRLKDTGADVVIEVGFNKPVDEIVFFAEYYKVDLIAMATHARVGLDRLLHGSVTETVMRRAHCPMLIVRVPENAPPRFAPLTD